MGPYELVKDMDLPRKALLDVEARAADPCIGPSSDDPLIAMLARLLRREDVVINAGFYALKDKIKFLRHEHALTHLRRLAPPDEIKVNSGSSNDWVTRRWSSSKEASGVKGKAADEEELGAMQFCYTMNCTMRLWVMLLEVRLEDGRELATWGVALRKWDVMRIVALRMLHLIHGGKEAYRTAPYRAYEAKVKSSVVFNGPGSALKLALEPGGEDLARGVPPAGP